MKTFDTVVVSNLKAIYNGFESDKFFFLKVEINDNNFENKYGLPGQFYEIKLDNGKNFALRKPISIYDIVEIEPERTQIVFLIKIVGDGTESLSSLNQGDMLNLLGPLGNSFAIENYKKYLFITGGCGYAPLFYFKKSLLKQTIFQQPEIKWIHGGRDKNEIFNSDVICTDDGSIGYKGNVIPQLIDFIQNYESKFDLKDLKIISCGPKPMLKAVTQFCIQKNIKIDVSLEEYMACGVGVCYGCTVKTKQMINNVQHISYQRVCKDGPVFDGYSIIWDDED
ncbi:MAG: dihydroorotate dehydrogenase electron transfer subunit [Candidatus Cloacimonetes bacterium]|nr:dihydroorotate dehydrogenase electron transfer subunit [Candidatus Cloacimonadota bacterium]MDD4157504.1 dihydroorotate dehydrogenase electron transfer subunit [Candidatus Cloacimonadota bacterium]